MTRTHVPYTSKTFTQSPMGCGPVCYCGASSSIGRQAYGNLFGQGRRFMSHHLTTCSSIRSTCMPLPCMPWTCTSVNSSCRITRGDQSWVASMTSFNGVVLSPSEAWRMMKIPYLAEPRRRQKSMRRTIDPSQWTNSRRIESRKTCSKMKRFPYKY